MDNYDYNESYFNQQGGMINNENVLYVLYLLLFILVLLLFYKFSSKYNLLISKLNQEQQVRIQQEIKQNSQNQIQPENISSNPNRKLMVNINQQESSHLPPPINPWREYDYRTLNDPLVAPRRRDDYNLPVLPLPTRGFPAPFKKMGLLIDKSTHNHDRYKILLLMGRNKHPNSTVYDYYAVENDKNSSLKFHIEGTRELQTGDHLRIYELDKKYNVVLDKVLGYEYDPYIY